ncbi:MCE family protein [Mycobacterium sp. AZCC_0083]|uniref:MCE family protein n=1 Tax=Mycobacterium sp. AZCC_0083 TaxID=2735882 RepID=UPI00160A1A45|nr:MCE family protein [Mycobacterium sp. AZCC_0083]MBB5168315.1 phospholipid/cholesterol/gamma-HCH transport system substrate-binding protein [Mycobacterium sp. AZCC_0083]
MLRRRQVRRIGSGWLALLLVVIVCSLVGFALGVFNQTFTSTVPVTLTADRSGLVMEPYAKVKMRGVQVGRVATVVGGVDSATIQLYIDPDQIKNIPANVNARISATSLFGGKFVDLIYPDDPSPQRLAAGAVLRSENVAVEVNTVFQNLVDLIKQVDPSKLNGVLSALAQGLGGKGDQIGESITDTNEVLQALNSRTDTMKSDFRALADVSDTYSGAAHDIIATVDALTTTSATVTAKSNQLDQLLAGTAGLSRSGVELVGPNKDNLVNTVNLLQPTTSLLMNYNPELTCLLVGADKTGAGLSQMLGGSNGKSLIMDAALLLGDDPYRYPDNLPIVAAKGGPGGKPGCGSLPDVAANWPVRYLVANTGFGTGVDMRPNPGIGFPGYADYLPVTRGVPEPPSIRYPGPPAPGPIPYPGAPPYGAPQYGPDGTPLYPGVAPAPQPEAAPADPAPPPP